MKPHQNITKTITSVTSWKIDGTKQRIDYESDNKTFYVWDDDGDLEASFELHKANWIMKLCGLARECDNWELEIGGKDIITNPSFVEVILDQFLYKPKVNNHNQ
jgi:hypothetical protein